MFLAGVQLNRDVATPSAFGLAVCGVKVDPVGKGAAESVTGKPFGLLACTKNDTCCCSCVVLSGMSWMTGGWTAVGGTLNWAP